MGNFIFSVIKDYDVKGRAQQEASENSLTTNNNIGEVVVIPVDGSKASEHAFNWYVNRLHRPENYVYVVHCKEVDQPSGQHFPQYALPPEEASKKLKLANSKGQNMLAMYHKKLEEMEITGKVYTETGRPGPIVVSVSDQFGATMIVMGTRGLGMIRRTLVGSVSSYVVRNSDIPVMVIPSAKPSVYY